MLGGVWGWLEGGWKGAKSPAVVVEGVDELAFLFAGEQVVGIGCLEDNEGQHGERDPGAQAEKEGNGQDNVRAEVDAESEPVVEGGPAPGRPGWRRWWPAPRPSSPNRGSRRRFSPTFTASPTNSATLARWAFSCRQVVLGDGQKANQRQ